MNKDGGFFSNLVGEEGSMIRMEFNNFIEHASLCLRTYNFNSQKLKISLAKSNVVFPGTFLKEITHANLPEHRENSTRL